MPPRRLQRALPETGRRSTPSGCATSPCSAGAGYSRSRRPHQPWPQSHRQPGGKYTHAHTAGERVREKNKPKSQSPPSTSRSLAYLPRVLLEPVELVYPRGRPLLLLLDLTDLGVAHEAGDVRNGTPQRGLARRRLHPPLLLLLLLLLLLPLRCCSCCWPGPERAGSNTRPPSSERHAASGAEPAAPPSAAAAPRRTAPDPPPLERGKTLR